MISLLELNSHGYPTTPEIDANLEKLLAALNKIRDAYGKPMTITSGLRSDAQQKALIAAGRSNAPRSHPLAGEAADVLDVAGLLKGWIKDHLDLMEEIGLWFED